MKKVNFADLKMKKIYAEYDGGVKVFNADEKRRKELIQIISENMDKGELNIDGKNVLLEVLPILTNIDLNGLEDDVIEDILKNPSDILENVIKDVTALTTKILNNITDNVNEISKMPEKEKKKFLEQFEEKVELSPDEEEKFKKWQKQNG